MSHADGPGPVFPDDVVAGDEIEDGRRPLLRTIATAVGTVVVVGLLIGLFLLITKLMTDTTTQAARIPLESGQVSVDAGETDVRFVPSDGEALVIRSKVTHGPLDAKYAAFINRREHIVLEPGCRALISPTCHVEVTMEVPAGYPIEVTSTSGNVRAQGLADRVLTVRTESGSVTGRDLEVTELSARSASGKVAASFKRQPFALKVRTGSGDVKATVPRGSMRYAVQVHSASGKVRNDLPNARGGKGLVVVRTESGDVELDGG